MFRVLRFVPPRTPGSRVFFSERARERARDGFCATPDEASRFHVVISTTKNANGSLIKDAINAASEVSTDTVVIVDESSRYDGVHSVMNRALGASTAFRVAMTATPIAASLDGLDVRVPDH